MPSDARLTANAPGRWASMRWPLILIAMLGGHMLLMFIALALALGGPTRAVEPDYYRKAQQWDEHQAAQRASDALGWTMALTPAALPEADGRRLVTLQLLDAEQQAIDGAAVELIVFHHAAAAEHITLTAESLGRGVYRLHLPHARPGVWEFRVTAVVGGQRFLDRREVMIESLSLRERVANPLRGVSRVRATRGGQHENQRWSALTPALSRGERELLSTRTSGVEEGGDA